MTPSLRAKVTRIAEPENAQPPTEEAEALVPTLKGKLDQETIEAMLADLQRFAAADRNLVDGARFPLGQSASFEQWHVGHL